MKMESIEDVTEEYIRFMKKESPNFSTNEKMFKIKLITECYGRLEEREMIWKESEFIHNLEKGYFMA